jgi:hypothetical protein
VFEGSDRKARSWPFLNSTLAFSAQAERFSKSCSDNLTRVSVMSLIAAARVAAVAL